MNIDLDGSDAHEPDDHRRQLRLRPALPPDQVGRGQPRRRRQRRGRHPRRRGRRLQLLDPPREPPAERRPPGAHGVRVHGLGAHGGQRDARQQGLHQPGERLGRQQPEPDLASAVVTGGGLRFIYGTGFSQPDQPGTITKVEALFFGYFGTALNDDFLNVTARLGASSSTAVIDTARIDSYVGEPPDLDPNSAIAWNVTTLRPGGGSWSWSDDFSTVQLEVNPTKASSADQRTFYLDAIGLRVTTDQACEASTSTTLSPVPLQDTYDTATVEFVSADPPPTSVDTGTGSSAGRRGPDPARLVEDRDGDRPGPRRRPARVSGTCGARSPPACRQRVQPGGDRALRPQRQVRRRPAGQRRQRLHRGGPPGQGGAARHGLERRQQRRLAGQRRGGGARRRDGHPLRLREERRRRWRPGRATPRTAPP